MTAETKKLNIIIYNSDLPVFPGAGSHEFLNTTELAKWAKEIGLVSMAHTSEDLEKAKCLEEKNVALYLWKAPHITPINETAPAAPPSKAVAPKRFSKSKKMIWYLHGLVLKWLDRQAKKISKHPEDLFYTDKLFRHLAAPLSQALTKTDWQVLIVIQSSAAKIIDYVPKHPVSVLVMHDIRSLVFERRAETLPPGRKKRFYEQQAKRYFHFEKKYCQKFDLIIALSEYDRDWIQKNYQPKRIAIVPIPIDTNYFKPQSAVPSEVLHRILFTGHMAHPPNIDAAIYFARDIFPLIKKQIRDAEFYIVGKNPAPEVLALADLPGVIVTGTVPDTRCYLETATLVVVPLRFGSGVRNKILEAWAMEKYIISTPIGAEGLTYENGKHLIIAKNTEEMVEAVLHALLNPNERPRLTQAGRQLAEKNHAPLTTGHHYFQEIMAVAEQKSKEQQTMRLGIDIRWMVPGLAGGIENVARSFINELNQMETAHHYTLMLNHTCRADFQFIQSSAMQLRCQRHIDILKNHLQITYGKLCSKLRIEHFYSPTIMNLRFLRQLNVDMIYSFPGYIRPELYPLPNILMVPDIQHEYLPEFFPNAILEERKRVYGDSINNATHLCAISEFTRQTLIDKLKISPDKITTILLAADPSFTTEQRADEVAILNKYQLTDQGYLFFPAHTWHHKNHLAAIKALKILRDKYQLTPHLICTGGAREAQWAIEECIVESHLQKQVRFLGYCPREHLPVLYRHAIALIYPSLFEGFGMPVLEAMKSGCPVICSNMTSLPEIAGHAAILTGPHDHEAIADAIFTIIRDQDARKSLQTKGLQQAAKFSWQKHTYETVRVFEQVFAKLRDAS